MYYPALALPPGKGTALAHAQGGPVFACLAPRLERGWTIRSNTHREHMNTRICASAATTIVTSAPTNSITHVIVCFTNLNNPKFEEEDGCFGLCALVARSGGV